MLKLSNSLQSAIGNFYARADRGYVKLVAEADPEKNENKVMKILDAGQKYGEGNIYISALEQKISKRGHTHKI